MIKLEPIEEGICALRMQSPESNNAIDMEFCQQLKMLVDQISSDSTIKAVILCGSSDYFSTGGSKDFLDSLHRRYQDHFEHPYARAVQVLLNIPVPVIAAMEGSATGGGLTLALYCDIIIAAEESRYGFSFMNMGFTPGMGTTALAKQSFHTYLGFEMMVTGDFPKGKELIGKCAFNHIIPKKSVMDKAISISRAIEEKPRHALEILKKFYSIEKMQKLESTSVTEAAMHYMTFNQNDLRSNLDETFA